MARDSPAPRTPPTKRHHLPFTASQQEKLSRYNRQPLVCRVNQIFALTCMASFVLQLFGSIVSWSLYSPNDASPLSFRQMSFNRGPESEQRRLVAVHTDAEKAEAEPKSLTLDEEELLAPPDHSGRLRILLGILTADFYNDQAYRRRHRMLFKIWNDPRVCSLPDFKTLPVSERYRCQIIYTFVMGGNPNATPQLVDDSRPMLATKPVKGLSTDINDADVTLLNIRENMNEGKSQTWLKFGAEIAEEYDLDYVVKCDADALLHLHEFFKFAYIHLPPAPYNRNIYVGALRDKAYWPKHKTEEERIRFESFFGNNFEGVHLYVAGQIYIMSTDLAKFVGQEALHSNCSYCEGHEDHDISAMAFHSPNPVKIVAVGRKQRFWEHPVKGEPRWKRIWSRETARMKGVQFEGKNFDKNSTFDAVMAAEARRHRG